MADVLNIKSINGSSVSFIETVVKMLIKSSEENSPGVLVDNKYTEFIKKNLNVENDEREENYEEILVNFFLFKTLENSN